MGKIRILGRGILSPAQIHNAIQDDKKNIKFGTSSEISDGAKVHQSMKRAICLKMNAFLKDH